MKTKLEILGDLIGMPAEHIREAAEGMRRARTSPLQTLLGAAAILAGDEIAAECPLAETGYCCDYAQRKRDEPCATCPFKGRNLTDEEREMIFGHND